MIYLRTMADSELKLLSIELKQWSDGKPSLGLRMQDDFPDEIYNAVDAITPCSAQQILNLLQKLKKSRS
jgi:hypothetical protein